MVGGEDQVAGRVENEKFLQSGAASETTKNVPLETTWALRR